VSFQNGDLAEVVLIQNTQNQQTLNVWQYQVVAHTGTWDGAQFAQAWWDEFKAVYRALAAVAFGTPFQSVRVTELNDAIGEYGEYGIPEAEQAGTRANPTANQGLPNFNAVGVRLTVPTRTTRPGQKRFAYLLEEDNASGVLQSGMTALIQTAMNKLILENVMSFESQDITVQPIVTRKNAAGAVIASQFITGYLINPQITSQNSRKVGRGA